MTSAMGKELTAISDMACQTVSDLLDLKHVTREIMKMILHAMELKGLSGSSLTVTRYKPVTPKPSQSVYPRQFFFTLRLDEQWGSCYTAHDGGFVRTTAYDNQLMLGKGLTLEVYKSDSGERVGIRYIKVAIKQDA